MVPSLALNSFCRWGRSSWTPDDWPYKSVPPGCLNPMNLYLYFLYVSKILFHWRFLFDRLSFVLNVKICPVANLILHPILGNDITIDWIPQTMSPDIILDSLQFHHSHRVLRPSLLHNGPISFSFLALSWFVSSNSVWSLSSWESWPQDNPLPFHSFLTPLKQNLIMLHQFLSQNTCVALEPGGWSPNSWVWHAGTVKTWHCLTVDVTLPHSQISVPWDVPLLCFPACYHLCVSVFSHSEICFSFSAKNFKVQSQFYLLWDLRKR